MSEDEEKALAEDHRKRCAYYRAFRRCGGSLSLSEWRSLSERDQAALGEASASVEAERAGLVASALFDLMFPETHDPLDAAAKLALEVAR